MKQTRHTVFTICILLISLLIYGCSAKPAKPMLPSEICVVDDSGNEKAVYRFNFDSQNRLSTFERFADEQGSEVWQSTEIGYDSTGHVIYYKVKCDSMEAIYQESLEKIGYRFSSGNNSSKLLVNSDKQLTSSSTFNNGENTFKKSEYAYRTKGKLTQRIDYLMDNKAQDQKPVELSKETVYYRYDQRTITMFQYSATPHWVINFFDLSFWAYNPVRVNHKGILRSTLNKRGNAQDVSYIDNTEGYPETITVKHEGETIIYKVKYTEVK